MIKYKDFFFCFTLKVHKKINIDYLFRKEENVADFRTRIFREKFLR